MGDSGNLGMNYEDFIGWEKESGDSLDLKRVYIDIAGDLVTGVMLSQIIYWHLPNSAGISKLRVQRNDRFWLAKQRTDWWGECRVSEKQVDRCIKKLVAKGIIVTKLFKFSGNPTTHISMNWDVLLPLLSQEITKVDFGKGGKSLLLKCKESNSAIEENVIPEKSKTYTKNTTENKSKTTTTKSVVVPDEYETYNEHTVSVALTEESVKELIDMLVPSEPWKLFHAAYVLNWQIAGGYPGKQYENLLAQMLRKGFRHPEACPTPSQAREAKQKAVDEKLSAKKLVSAKEEYWKTAEKEFDMLPPEMQASILDEVKKKYPLVENCMGLKALAEKLYMDRKKQDEKSN